MNTRRTLVSILGILLLLAPASALAASESRQERGDISITYNGELDKAHGVRRGSGTMADPYVISGWHLQNLSIRDTDKVIMIMDNTITGQLTLDWVGHHVHVMNNQIGDLRVNQNNARYGEPMGGPIVDNAITVVGQLRHFDGLFARNTIGTPAAGTLADPYPSTRAVNFDGFNGARFVNNTLWGYLDARLHGHHHGSDFLGDSHAHADSHGPEMDHSKRFHRGRIAGNTIYTAANYALAYLDTNHAANDRTANSETNPYLNAPHVHRTKIALIRNELIGAGLLVDVFNARDEKHIRLGHGTLTIAKNSIDLSDDPTRPFRTLNGIEVRQARSLRLVVNRNAVTAPEPLLGVDALRPVTVTGAGISLDTLDVASVLLRANSVTNRAVGVSAARLTEDVSWRIVALSTSGVGRPVTYDDSVRNPPDRG